MRDDGRREVRRITYDAAVEAIESIYYEVL
jgi:hypothetical protein